MLLTHMVMKLGVARIFLRATFTGECFCLLFCYTSFLDLYCFRLESIQKAFAEAL